MTRLNEKTAGAAGAIGGNGTYSHHMGWREVDKSGPCPIFGKPDWCGRSADGAMRCMRIADAPAGWRVVKRNGDGGTVYRPDGEPGRSPSTIGANPKPAKSAKTHPTLHSAIAAVARSTGGEHAGTWTYRRGDGADEFWVCRFNLADGTKQFRPVHCNGAGFIIGDPPGTLPLYRLPELQGVPLVYLCEGEKAADAAWSIGLIATTSAHGSKSAAKSNWEPLRGKTVVILPDNDEAGEHYAATVATILHRLDCTVRIVRLPNLPMGGDIFDWIAARDSVESETIRVSIGVLAEASPVWEPPVSPNDPSGGESEPVIVRLADVKPEPLRWLWPGRFPLGKLSLCYGDPSVNKSTLTMDMAARVSCGTPWPDLRGETNPAGGVVVLNAEDDLVDTVKPRLMAAGACMERIISIAAVKRAGRAGTSHFSLVADLPALERAIREVSARLVVIDPLTAYLDKTDSHTMADVRGLLAPLKDLSGRTGAAIVAVTHMNKSAGGKALYRATGSLGFIAAARAGWLVIADEENPNRRKMLWSKGNLSKQRSGLAFTIQSVEVPGLDEHPIVLWEPDPIEMIADEALAMQQSDEDRTAREDAVEWLHTALADGAVPADELKRQAKANSISAATLRRAKCDAGVQAKRIGFGEGGRWYWALPGAPNVLTNAIDAHPNTVSINGECEHL